MIGNLLTQAAIEAAERGWAPDLAVRMGIRHLLRRRLHVQRRSEQRRREASSRSSGSSSATERFLQEAARSELAIATDVANQQHYEVPASFFNWVLGPRKKYSCCYFDDPRDDLAGAEERALELTAGHAGLADGMDVLELGCGWGSLTLWMLERYPTSRVVAVSNSRSQRAFIERQAQLRGFSPRLEVITADIRHFQASRRVDRVVSVEMFEHVRNHRLLLERVSRWLHADGKLFVHIFCHRAHAYPFETHGPADWMARHFFTGGMMPDRQIFRRLNQHFEQEAEWVWDGRHYERTCRWWVANMERNRAELIPLLDSIYGPDWGRRWYQRWRLFFMACGELFGFRNGSEWHVGHYLLRPVEPRKPNST